LYFGGTSERRTSMVTRSCGNRRALINTGFLVGLCFADGLVGTATAEVPCGIRALYKRDGWAIPGLAGAVTVKHSVPTEQGDSVLVEILKPNVSAASITIVLCASDEPGRVEIRDQAVDVLELRRYSVLGRVFAYRVNAEHVSVEGKTRVALGAAEVLMYYDTDGAGLFKLREYGSSIPYRLRVPDWVRAPSGRR
jgi:hypothetical protein